VAKAPPVNRMPEMIMELPRSGCLRVADQAWMQTLRGDALSVVITIADPSVRDDKSSQCRRAH
jgi:hypothetical protein